MNTSGLTGIHTGYILTKTSKAGQPYYFTGTVNWETGTGAAAFCVAETGHLPGDAKVFGHHSLADAWATRLNLTGIRGATWRRETSDQLVTNVERALAITDFEILTQDDMGNESSCADFEFVREQLFRLKQFEDDKTSFLTLATAHAVWSDRTFGTPDVKGPAGPLKHLIKEAKEALKNPNDPLEYADCLFLVLDGARRTGISAIDLIYAGFMKMKVLHQRTYTPDPNNPDEPVEHDREVG